jgi:hypothetical protein
MQLSWEELFFHHLTVWGFCFVLFSVLGLETQGLYLKPLHQPFIVMGFFQDRTGLEPGYS